MSGRKILKFTRMDMSQPKRKIYRALADIGEQVSKNAYPPFSDYSVGAAAWLWDGSVYAGSRVENVGYTGSHHAEQAAIDAAITNGALARAVAAGLGPQQFVKAVAYVPLGQPGTWPTGSSRQCLCDFGLDTTIVVQSARGRATTKTLRQLFPHAFAADVLSYWVGT